MNSFWRLPVQSKDDVESMVRQSCLVAPSDLFHKIKPKHGIVLSEWDEPDLVGKVIAFGVIKSVNIPDQSAQVEWRTTDVTLKPNPSGRQFWRNKPYFKFAKDVSVRYMLDDLFSEHYPELDGMEFGGVTGGGASSSESVYQEIPGYVYLIESDHGYKIGKTVNIKTRTSLFSVKLPFPIRLINYAWFENYSKAERDFHKQFAHKRLEGEWFDLSDDDISKIKKEGQQVPVEGL